MAYARHGAWRRWKGARLNAARKAAVRGITAHDATVRNGAIRATADSIPKTLHVISPLGWIAEAFAMPQINAAADCAAGCIPGWRIVQHSTLEPARDLADDATWIAPETLVSLNAWRAQQDLEPLMFRAPRPDWPDLLPSDLSGRSMLIATVAEIAAWHEFPADLGSQPWSQLCNGRVAGFNAARRDLDALQSVVSDAPAESNIMLSEHVPGISEEWNVLVHYGVAAAASPYCLHTPRTAMPSSRCSTCPQTAFMRPPTSRRLDSHSLHTHNSRTHNPSPHNPRRHSLRIHTGIFTNAIVQSPHRRPNALQRRSERATPAYSSPSEPKAMPRSFLKSTLSGARPRIHTTRRACTPSWSPSPKLGCFPLPAMHHIRTRSTPPQPSSRKAIPRSSPTRGWSRDMPTATAAIDAAST